ncbi:hypothetical protein U9M48_008243 [Paspalum notatum var. saurae]|uniref:Uncharacterized protein n=1 Tax=Paspalum notatum var. saurae TaxID=547442 RepID=A0AAQ3SPM2_PASNO
MALSHSPSLSAGTTSEAPPFRLPYGLKARFHTLCGLPDHLVFVGIGQRPALSVASSFLASGVLQIGLVSFHLRCRLRLDSLVLLT